MSGWSQHGVVPGLGDLDHRGDPAQLLEHEGADLGRDQAVLGAQQGQAAVDLVEVGHGQRAHAGAELLEDAAVELPLPAAVDPPERVAGHEVDHVVEVVLLGRHGAEAGDGVVDGGVGPGPAEGVAGGR